MHRAAGPILPQNTFSIPQPEMEVQVLGEKERSGAPKKDAEMVEDINAS